MPKFPDEAAGLHRKWLPIAALLLLSLLWAADWVRADLFPGATAERALNPLLIQAALTGVFAFLAAIAALALKQRWPTQASASRAVLVGTGLFVLPPVLTLLARESLDNATEVALFSLTPLFAIVFQPHLESSGEQLSIPRGGFLAAMLAVAGTFLVFPVEMPRSYSTAFALFGFVAASALAAAANCVGIQIVRRGSPISTFAAVATGSAACLLAILSPVIHQTQTAATAFSIWPLLRLLALALLFWLMRHMGAAQMTTRFLIAPLLANLISIAFLRPHLQIQAWIGLLLIAAGSGWMLFAPIDSGEHPIPTLDVR